MRVIIAGGRDYKLTDEDFGWLDALHREHGFTHIISGKCSGADNGGETWAMMRGVSIVPCPAKWTDFSDPRSVKRYRRDGSPYNAAAGPIRNEQMALQADACVLFPGGSGTASMKKLAQKHGLQIFEQGAQ